MEDTSHEVEHVLLLIGGHPHNVHGVLCYYTARENRGESRDQKECAEEKSRLTLVSANSLMSSIPSTV
jgi:hypothetical protein